MRHFLKILHGLDTTPLLHQLARNPQLWNANRERTTFSGTPFAGCDDIWLRFSPKRPDGDADGAVCDAECTFHDAFYRLSEARPLVRAVMLRAEAYALDRVLISKLPPGGRILPHSDAGNAYTGHPDRVRYHVVLQGLPGNLFRNADEVVSMHTGEAWLFDARLEHECENKSPDERIHMLVDVRVMPTCP